MAHRINPRHIVRAHPGDLKGQIADLCAAGYQIVYQDTTTAQLKKRKSISCLTAVISSLFFGVGLLVYLLIFWLVTADDTVYIDLAIQ